MKIIFLNRYFYPDHSATSQLLGDLAFALAAKGIAVTVITSRQMYDKPAAGLPAQETVQGVRVLRVWTSSFGRGNLLGRSADYLSFYISALLNLLKEVDRHDTIVAKTDPPLISVIACVAAKLRKATLINWIQDLFPEVAIQLGIGFLRGSLGGLLKRVRNYSLQVAGCNVVLGEQMRKMLIKEGIAAERVTVIHNWSVEDTVYPVERNNNTLRHSWGLSGKFVVGYSGNMGRAHDFDAILGAAEILRKRSDIVFLFIGDGVQRPRVEEQVVSRRMSNVMLKPYQPREQLAESLGVADVHFISLKPELEGLIVPSKYYGVAAAGRPVIFAGSPEGEVAGMLTSAGSGIVVEPGNAQALADAIEHMSAVQERCDQMGANARLVFERDYGMKKSLQAWYRVLGVTEAIEDYN